MSDPGLMIDVDETHGPAGDGERPAFFVADIRGAVVADAFNPVNYLTFVVFRYEIGIAGVLYQTGNPLQGPVPVLFFPFVALWCAVQHLAQTVLICFSQTEESGTFGAQGTFVDWVVRDRLRY